MHTYNKFRHLKNPYCCQQAPGKSKIAKDQWAGTHLSTTAHHWTLTFTHLAIPQQIHYDKEYQKKKKKKKELTFFNIVFVSTLCYIA